MNNQKHLFGNTGEAKQIRQVTNVPAGAVPDLDCKVCTGGRHLRIRYNLMCQQALSPLDRLHVG